MSELVFPQHLNTMCSASGPEIGVPFSKDADRYSVQVETNGEKLRIETNGAERHNDVYIINKQGEITNVEPAFYFPPMNAKGLRNLAGALRGCASGLSVPATQTTLRDIAAQVERLAATRR